MKRCHVMIRLLLLVVASLALPNSDKSLALPNSDKSLDSHDEESESVEYCFDETKPCENKADSCIGKDCNCFCDELCRRYKDCCRDSEFYMKVEQRADIAPFSCVMLRHFGGIYMMTTCPTTWADRRVRTLCEVEGEVKRDPVLQLPVTSHRTNITYRNPYCALCRGDTQSLQLWTMRIESATLDKGTRLTAENVTRTLLFNNESGWGINLNRTFHPLTVDPVIPDTASHLVRHCQADTINTCALNWTDSNVRDRCETYTFMVYSDTHYYRNLHCAMCNHEPLEALSCGQIDPQTSSYYNFNSVNFALLLDFSGGATVGKVQPCVSTQFYDPFFQKCRDIISSVVESKESSMTEYHKLSLTNNNTQCNSTILNSNEFKIENNSIFIPAYKIHLKQGEYSELDNGTIKLCVGTLGKLEEHFQNNYKFSVQMGFITFAGLGISIIFLILHLTAFSLVPELRNLAGKNLSSLCTALLVAYTAFLTRPLFESSHNPCLFVALLTYYCFLSSFFWMLTIAFDVWRGLRSVSTRLRVVGGKQCKRFTIYSLWSWVAPGIIVLSTFLIEIASGSSVPVELRPEFVKNTCWFGPRRALLVYLAAPLGVIMLLNVALFSSSARMVCTKKLSIKSTSYARRQKDFRLFVRLAFIMGLTWVVGLVAGALDNLALWYFFIALNTLQGLFIFLAFTCRERVAQGLALCMGDIRPLKFFSGSEGSTTSTLNSYIISKSTSDKSTASDNT